VALHLDEELPERTRNSLSAIKEASKEALTELRSVLDILRQEGEPAPRSPTSTLARLDDVVSQTAAAEGPNGVRRRRPALAFRRRCGGVPDRAGGTLFAYESGLVHPGWQD
jgi:hypothetical protein